MPKSTKAVASVIDLTANPLFAEALALQSRLASMTADIAAMRGERNDAEFRQYITTALAAAKMGIAPRSKGATAMREAFIGAGRTKRNAQTIVEATLNKRVAAMARAASGEEDPVAALITSFAELEIDSVSSLKRWLAPAVDKVDRLLEAIGKLSDDDADTFASAIAAWLDARDAATATVADDDDAADDVAA
jgi:hypothetical protein